MILPTKKVLPGTLCKIVNIIKLKRVQIQHQNIPDDIVLI